MTAIETPRATPRNARFWNRIAKKYARSPIADEAAYQRKLAETQALMRPDMQVMEFGCGTGGTALSHSQHVDQVTAVDISSEMIAIAEQKKTDAHVTNVEFIVSDFAEFPAPDRRFDMILGMSILHLVPDQTAALKKTYEMLEPGGYFVSSTACIADFMPALRFVAGIGHALRLLPFVRVFDRATLERNILSAGFTIETAWQPSPKNGVFIIARKPTSEG